MRMGTLAAALMLVGACRTSADARAKAKVPAEHAEAGKAAKVDPAPTPGEGAKAYKAPEGPPQLLLMVVMDAVRADHLGICGYDRPTSFQLSRLKERGAVMSCDAYSPASWTLPSHASYFTGRFVQEHGVSEAPAGAQVNPNVNLRPLDPSYETLAEALKARGFQTAFVSGNPIIRAETGLHQGFDVVKVAEAAGGGLRGEALVDTLKSALSGLDASKPLFLFVNVYDAHDPYPAVPAKVEWLPSRTELRVSPTQKQESNDFWRFNQGKMGDKEKQAWLDHLKDTYDWGIHEADVGVGKVVETVRELGFSDHGVRMVVTADHGELLGEHGLLRHGGYVYEGVVRVPFLWFDNQKQTQVELPRGFSAAEAYWLLLDGKLHDQYRVATSVSAPNADFFQPGVNSVAVWNGPSKGIWEEGTTFRYDLDADPGEETKLPLEGEQAARVAKEKEAFEAMNQRPVPETEGLTQALQAMGYVQ